MGKHSGEPAAPPPLPRRRLLFLALGIVATLVAWGVLVLAAIDFGSQARGGEKPAWVFTGLATVGATACLLVTLILVARFFSALRRQAPVSDPLPGGGRRVAR